MALGSEQRLPMVNARARARARARAVALSIVWFFCLAFPAMAKIEVPSLTGRVVDLADLLPAATEAELVSRLEAHERASTNQIVVVTLPDLQGRPIEEWGLTLGREWGIGQEGKDNGVVFLIAPNERQVRIEVGYGLEGTLPDAVANSIIQHEVIQRFKQGDMAGGIRGGLDGILAALDGTYQPSMAVAVPDAGYSPLIDTLVPIGFFAVSVAVGLLMCLRRRWDKKRNRYVWYIARSTGGGSDSRSSSFGRSGGFSGGGGSFGGGGASGRW